MDTKLVQTLVMRLWHNFNTTDRLVRERGSMSINDSTNYTYYSKLVSDDLKELIREIERKT